MISIAGKIAVITGAGRGIGRATAIELARHGATVIVSARSVPDLESTAAAIGAQAHVIAADVRVKQQVHALIDRAAAIGPIDILVNCAGVPGYGPLTQCSDENYAAVMETNLRGTFFTCRYVLPSMIERRTGHIINIASIAGKVGSANRAVYCASKFGMIGLSESLAEEVREYGVRVSIICPGSTDTTFSPNRPAKSSSKLLRPEDVAYAVRTLAAQEPNSFISEITMRPTQKP